MPHRMEFKTKAGMVWGEWHQHRTAMISLMETAPEAWPCYSIAAKIKSGLLAC